MPLKNIIFDKKNVSLHIVYTTEMEFQHHDMSKDISTVRSELFPDCPIRNVLARVGDKWSLLVLYTLQHNGTLRFSALQRAIPDISQKSLAKTLRILEEDGFIDRTVYPEVPPRVEYSLTLRAQSFLPIVEQLIGWAKDNLDRIIADRATSIMAENAV